MLSRWQDGYGVVFAVMVQIAGSIRVSRYKLTKYLKLSHDAGTLKGAPAQCRDTNLQWNQYWIKVHKFYWKQMRVSGFILFYLSVKKAGTIAKTVTNLLILLTVLCKVVLFFPIRLFCKIMSSRLFIEHNYPYKSLYYSDIGMLVRV